MMQKSYRAQSKDSTSASAEESLLSDAKKITKHPLPKELQLMSENETVCKFCGISYLIHRQVKALQASLSLYFVSYLLSFLHFWHQN